MDETIYVILKVLFDFALEVWFSISSACLVWYRKKNNVGNMHIKSIQREYCVLSSILQVL